MSKPNIIEFERLIRAYLAGEVRWDAVHQYAVEMEWQSATDFPDHIRGPLEDLHIAFLADESDDPQFRLDPSEIRKLLDELGRTGSTGPPS